MTREQAAEILDQGDEVEGLHPDFCCVNGTFQREFLPVCPFNNARFGSFIELTQAGESHGCTTRKVGENERKR